MNELSGKQRYLNMIPDLNIKFPFLPELAEDSHEVCAQFILDLAQMRLVHFPQAGIVVTPYGICSEEKLEELQTAYMNYRLPNESEVKPKMKKATPKKATAKAKAKSASKKKC